MRSDHSKYTQSLNNAMKKSAKTLLSEQDNDVDTNIPIKLQLLAD